MAAGASLGFATSMMKSKAEAEALLKDSELQRKRLEYNRSKQTNTYDKNLSAVNRAEIENAANIEKARLKAESDLAGEFAGSGIRGTSVDELSAEISTEATIAQNKNKEMSVETQKDLFTTRQAEEEQAMFDAQNMPTFDANLATQQAFLQGASQGLGLYRG